MKKYGKRIVLMLLACIMFVNSISTAVHAAPLADIPKAMLDNVYLDALSYTGYRVQTQKDDGTIYVKYGSKAPDSVRSKISYGTGPSGLETIANGSTKTGLAPNISKFESGGLCCASYISYVYYNYLPNIAGVDTSGIPVPTNSRLASAYNDSANSWVSSGKARRISFTQSSSGSTFTPTEEIPIGSLIIYREAGGTRISHVALYAGYYGGSHFVTHVGNSRGPEISTVENSSKGDSPNLVQQVIVPYFVEANGTIEVYKKDTDGKKLAGAVFVATSKTDSSRQYQIGPTNAEGYATAAEAIPYGEYVIRETIFPTNYRKYGQSEWSVTVGPENDGKVTIHAVNEMIPGVCESVKQSEDGEIDGISFRIQGNGTDQIVKTSDGGKIKVDNLKPGNYTVTELTPDKYVPQQSQKVTIESGKTSTVKFSNKLKKWRLEMVKLDSEQKETKEGQAQGDATLEGAVYGLFQGNTLMDTYTTDETGSFVSDYYICGNQWTLKEITPSEGYLLDTEVYPIDAEAEKFTIERSDIQMTVKETVIKGKIALVKHTDDGKTQIETPEAGAEFKVYLKSAASYDRAKETECDLLVCDENGYAVTKELPYGVYTVQQTKGWIGKELLDPFDVFISQDGKVYSFIINNATFTSYLQVVKTDAETGKNIPYAGAGFQIYKPDGTKIEMTYTYPEITTIDTFYTASDGSLVTPETLEYGKGYMLVEVSAPYGYVLDSTPLYFDIAKESAAEISSKTIVKVERLNTPQKGKITIKKEGEILSSVVETDGKYHPVYENHALKGAVFEIFAAEDIYTPDGTLRYSRDEFVDRIETGTDGKGITKALYLGTYTIKEVQAPVNMVLSKDVESVALVYAGQEIAITSVEKTMHNERQKVSISLEKELETDELFDVGNETESVKFGLYVAEELTAVDGSVFPKDGLLEIASCDKDGKLCFQTDVPAGMKMYVKETENDKHYLLNDTVFMIEYVYGGQDVSVVHLKVNQGEKIENKLIRGTVCGKKTDENGNVVSGAVFGLFKVDELSFEEEQALLTARSNENGLFEFKDIPYGTWMIKELKAPSQFVLDETLHEVTISTQGEIIEITIENKRIPQDIIPQAPQTGDRKNIGFEMGLLAIALSSMVSVGIMYRKKKKEDNKV